MSLARLITGEDGSNEPDEVNSFDYTSINNTLAANTLTAFRSGERQSLGNVLLTGATGYLGIHILRELIDSDASHIYCLVRGKTEEAAERRLRTLLYYYFLSRYLCRFYFFQTDKNMDKDFHNSLLHLLLPDIDNL